MLLGPTWELGAEGQKARPVDKTDILRAAGSESGAPLSEVQQRQRESLQADAARRFPLTNVRLQLVKMLRRTC